MTASCVLVLTVRTAWSAGTATAVAKVERYADRVFTARDLNHDGVLTADEWAAMSGDPQGIDRDQDGAISKGEFRSHILDYGRQRQPAPLTLDDEQTPQTDKPSASPSATAANGEPAISDAPVERSETAAPTTRFTVRPSRGLGNLPGWFVGRDRDGDGQLTLLEFVGNAAGSSREFDRLDLNGDGVVTPGELRTPRTDTQPASP